MTDEVLQFIKTNISYVYIDALKNEFPQQIILYQGTRARIIYWILSAVIIYI